MLDFPPPWPHVFCELKFMKIVILIYQIIQEKFAYGKLFMLVMIGYIFIIKMVKKIQNSGLELVAGLTRPLKYPISSYWYADIEQFKLIHLILVLSIHFKIYSSVTDSRLICSVTFVAKKGGSLISVETSCARLTLKKLMCVKKRSKPGIKPHPSS